MWSSVWRRQEQLKELLNDARLSHARAPARRFKHHSHFATATARATEALCQPGQREGAAARAYERFHIQLGAITAFTLMLQALAAVVQAANADPPGHRISVAKRLNLHRNKIRTKGSPVKRGFGLLPAPPGAVSSAPVRIGEST